MKNKLMKFNFKILCVVLLFSNSLLFAQFQIKKQIIANGGSKSSSTNFKMQGTVNEVFIGNSSSNNSTAKAGFWNYYFDAFLQRQWYYDLGHMQKHKYDRSQITFFQKGI